MNIKRLIAAVAACACGAAMTLTADTPREVIFTTNPQMSCANCEKKIKQNMRFEKGVKSVTTSLTEQRVTVTYDPAKTDEITLGRALGKLGYRVKILRSKAAADTTTTKK